MKFSLLTLASVLSSALAAVASAVDTRALAANQAFAVAASNYNFTSDFAPALAYTFHAIASIPDDVLAAGQDAANAWLVDNNYRAAGATLAADGAGLEARGFWQVTKCVGSVMWALGSTAIPVAKIARIKKYIEALGGVKKAVQLMLGATTKAEKLKAGGQALVSLSAELLGIAGVKANCF